eukprot:TRINITY_DN15450_c0_g1::TRINITY_DN15450_c0_g1_i1::g.30462::m.30462 TRINITY_DN15450_c0_g1::TRINITY_DN15450_c0_g1_i1::g.30462  ORF type:complete len:211 (-),score=33.58 TRINITY_DN15450_c0_g1_i1:147-779(-)
MASCSCTGRCIRSCPCLDQDSFCADSRCGCKVSDCENRRQSRKDQPFTEWRKKFASTMAKKGNCEDGTDAAHILSFEILDEIYARKQGTGYCEDTIKEIVTSLNACDNLRIKTVFGNRSTDASLDKEIIRVANKTEKCLSEAACQRARAQCQILRNSMDDVPEALIKAGIAFYNSLPTPAGTKQICRANAKIYSVTDRSRRLANGEISED